MNKLLFLLLLPFIFSDCRNKKTKLADEDTVEINDFIEFFQPATLPVQVNENLLNRKETDSASIGYKIFTQFIPDTVLLKQFGARVKPSLYPIGKVVIKKFETYLFLKAITPGKKAAYILAFDKNNKFVTAMPLVVTDKDASTTQSAEMDTRYAITQSMMTKNDEGQQNEAKKVYILNGEARAFSMIMTDEGVSDKPQEVINPIDTFPQLSKFSGDYIRDKRNLVSIRDGKTPSSILFFIHFEKDDGECKGELKGMANITALKTAVFKANGSPCELEFTFNANTISLRETAACGSYRDIKCFFDGSFSKKKESKPKPGNKRKI